MEGEGEIVCSVEKWCSLVDRLTPDQRDALRHTGIYCMLQMHPIAMREHLIRYTVEIYNPKTKRFVVRSKVEFTATPVDVECIYGLQNSGLCCKEIIKQEYDRKVKIPAQFINKKTGNIVIEDLITYIVESGSADDDFVRMMGLVLFATVIAPQYRKIVPKEYYVLVKDVDRFKELNLNEFTLNTLLDWMRQARNGKVMAHWPLGNTSLLQVHINS